MGNQTVVQASFRQLQEIRRQRALVPQNLKADIGDSYSLLKESSILSTIKRKKEK
jgi:hypothetical protein